MDLFSHLGCLNEKDIELYKSLADYSGGQVLYFSDKNRIGLTLNLIKKGLIGGSRIPVIPNKRRKRGLGDKQLSILVDNSVETLTTTVVDPSNRDVKLYNPGKSNRFQSIFSLSIFNVHFTYHFNIFSDSSTVISRFR